jgi:endonuclease-8
VPEGDTIFRTARTLNRALAGKPITAFESTFPLLTRFNDDHPLAGQIIESVESRGKWLLIHLSGGATLTTHMLMSGSWHIYRPGERWQRPHSQMRIVLATSDYVAVAFTVPVAKMLRARELEREFRIPVSTTDVLSPGFDAAEAAHRIAACGAEEIGNVLLRQTVIAGIGNVYKSEICFLTGINPYGKVASLPAQSIQQLVATAQRLMNANVLEDSGDAIVTYAGRKRRTTHAADPGENLWAYGRAGEPCRRCATLIERYAQGPDARVTYWCPHCQPMHGTNDPNKEAAL